MQINSTRNLSPARSAFGKDCPSSDSKLRTFADKHVCQTAITALHQDLVPSSSDNYCRLSCGCWYWRVGRTLVSPKILQKLSGNWMQSRAWCDHWLHILWSPLSKGVLTVCGVLVWLWKKEVSHSWRSQYRALVDVLKGWTCICCTFL